MLQLDDYYKDGDDPTLPRFDSGAVDWDHPDSWNAAAALRGLARALRDRLDRCPDLRHQQQRRQSATECSTSATHRRFIAEGIFAAELVGACRDTGLPTTAICVRRSRWVTFVLRLVRDLREHRKPPLFLVKRGWWLTMREPEIVAALVAKGCTRDDAAAKPKRRSASSPSGARSRCTSP